VAFTDLPIESLVAYRPDVDEPADFDAFWAETLARASEEAWEPRLVEAASPISELRVEDLTFAGFAGDPISAWVTRPVDERPRAAVVEYVGYNGGRGVVGENLRWAAAGYVHVLMDTRGQGSGWGTGGDTADPHGSGSSVPGFMTKGIENPESYFYRRVFTDAARLVDVVRGFPFVDADRIAVTGASQGGGIAIAVAALSPHVKALMPDVPYLCHFRRAVEVTPQEPFTEITRYLAVHRDRTEQVFRTLGYVDGVNFARRVHVPSLFSVALMDGIVLPSTVYAAYNRLATRDAEIVVYPYNGHEGGQTHQWVRQAEWLAARFS
jgi:cephalosporin-C deacetylase